MNEFKYPVNINHRDQIPWLLNALYKHPLIGAEVGVQSGLFSEVLLRSVTWEKFYCIDAWKHLDNYEDGANVEDNIQEVKYLETRARLKAYDHKIEYIRKLSIDAARDLKDDSLDFIYIDANHSYDAVILDLINYYPKVKKGGIISGHDYCGAWQGVIKGVDTFVKAYNIQSFYKHPSESSYIFIK